MKITNFLFAILIINIISCSDIILDLDEEFIELEEDSDTDGLVVYYDRFDNSVFSIETNGKNKKLIEDNNLSPINSISLSYDKEKVAWLNTDNEIYIYDINGTFIEKITPSGNVFKVEWVNFSENTLVYNEGMTLQKWGSTNYNLPPFENFTDFTPPSFGFVANQFLRSNFTISPNNDIAIHHYNFNNSIGYQHAIEIVKSNGEKLYKWSNILPYNMKFSNENNQYLSIFGDNFTSSGDISVIYRLDNNIQEMNSFTSGYYNLILSNSANEFIASSGFSNLLDGSRNLVYTNSSSSAISITDFINNNQNITFDWKH